MPSEPAISAVARVIQLSIAPVFLLTALGTMLGVFSTRLGRIVDRTRVLADRMPSLAKERQEAMRVELSYLRRRRRVVNVAIGFGTAAALLVCLLIATAFVSSLGGWDVSVTIALLFVLAMLGFICALVAYFLEVMLAVRAARIEEPPVG